jgi:hypothetical protein
MARYPGPTGWLFSLRTLLSLSLLSLFKSLMSPIWNLEGLVPLPDKVGKKGLLHNDKKKVKMDHAALLVSGGEFSEVRASIRSLPGSEATPVVDPL